MTFTSRAKFCSEVLLHNAWVKLRACAHSAYQAFSLWEGLETRLIMSEILSAGVYVMSR